MKKNIQFIIGIDEVGRGPLAGPITVAAVVMPKNLEFRISNLEGIRDSKKLSARQRQQWDIIIRKNFVFAISSVYPNTIDSRGISHAARTAVARCLTKLNSKFDILNSNFSILLDGGLYAPAKYVHQQTIIKGDELNPLISAASIIAKVHRDRYMTRLHIKEPLYGFFENKGYGTLAHRTAITTYGPSRFHRISFCKNLILE